MTTPASADPGPNTYPVNQLQPPTAAYPVVDEAGNGMWLHPTCGNIQWNPVSDKPEWCERCSFRTDRWTRVCTQDRLLLDRSAAAAWRAGGAEVSP
jgi:hypothetical protein